MGFFTKSGVAKTAKHFRSEIGRANSDRDKLRALLPEARANLTLAVDERRANLSVEALADAGVVARDKVDSAKGKLEDIEYLISELDSRISALEVEHSAALDREAREGAVSELEPSIAALAAALGKVRDAGTVMAAAATEVVKRTPLSNANFGTDLASLFGGISVNVEQVIASANSYVAALKAGDARPRAVEVAYVAPKPAPAGPLTEVLLVSNSCWTEGNETLTAPRWSLRFVPTAIAERAEKLGWCFRRSHPMVQQLLDSLQVAASGPYHWVDPNDKDTVNLQTVTSRPPGSVEAAQSLPPAERIGATVVGTARAVPVVP